MKGDSKIFTLDKGTKEIYQHVFVALLHENIRINILDIFCIVIM